MNTISPATKATASRLRGTGRSATITEAAT